MPTSQGNLWAQAVASSMVWHSFFVSSKKIGFHQSQADSSLHILWKAGTTLYLLIYGDDILITSNNQSEVKDAIEQLNKRFDMKDLGELSTFLEFRLCPPPRAYFFINRLMQLIYFEEQAWRIVTLYQI